MKSYKVSFSDKFGEFVQQLIVECSSNEDPSVTAVEAFDIEGYELAGIHVSSVSEIASE